MWAGDHLWVSTADWGMWVLGGGIRHCFRCWGRVVDKTQTQPLGADVSVEEFTS